MYNYAPLSLNHYFRYSFLSSSENSPQNVAPTNILSTLSSFSLFFAQQPTALWPLFPQLLHCPLKWVFLLFFFLFMLLFSLLSFPQKYDIIWLYLPHLLHVHLNNLPFLYCLISTVFNSITLSTGSGVSWFLFLFNSVLQNKQISIFRLLNEIFDIFTFQ